MKRPATFPDADIPTGEVVKLLNSNADRYNQRAFIENDPISIPHGFKIRQDIEIIGLWTALLAWGRRATILQKASELAELMDGAPHEFITQHNSRDLKRFLQFRHRTFNATDALYFIDFFRRWYSENDTLENAFSDGLQTGDEHVQNALINFHNVFTTSEDFPQRTRKHIANPLKGSSCKRLNMFLRWMVRRDNRGVDFGIWKTISPSQLICPLDVHVHRTAIELGILKRKMADWRAAVELTAVLKTLDAEDPAKYDFALFGMGVNRQQFA